MSTQFERASAEFIEEEHDRLITALNHVRDTWQKDADDPLVDPNDSKRLMAADQVGVWQRLIDKLDAVHDIDRRKP